MVCIRVFYKENSVINKEYNLISGCTKISSIEDSKIVEEPTFYLENRDEFISNWNNAVNIANGKKLKWFINVTGMEETFCFSGVPMPTSEKDLLGSEQGVNITQISDCRWENFGIKNPAEKQKGPAVAGGNKIR